MHEVDAQRDGGPGGVRYAGQFRVGVDGPRHERNGRVQPKCLLDDLVHELEVVEGTGGKGEQVKTSLIYGLLAAYL